jgi:hypothetical protein
MATDRASHDLCARESGRVRPNSQPSSVNVVRLQRVRGVPIDIGNAVVNFARCDLA